ncbi:restriction endonuclease subunit S [Peptostreptococcus stomatis]|uniref:restriction endonuclease subunit S n=1 Tax=Peptostreptococcus stomatis TaxID=341694 RepID=UPI0026EFABF2|nr:restriction endonuclease subunit S [Peptostreptococcus stomatis]
MKDRKKPAIRFKGFTEDWEQRKLGDVVGITSGFMGDSLLSDGKYHLTRIETIADGIVDENRVGYSNEKPDDMYLLKHGDILYSNINSISHMGKVAKYQGNSPLYHGINLMRLQPENNINSDFLLYLLNTEKCRNWAKTRANQAVSQASINQSLLTTQEIAISSFEEQKKIGDYFRNLDNLITLHQRKYDKLVNVKKSMLEKMFPRDGKFVPDVRFSGFTEDWEQRKLDDFVTFYSGLTYSPKDIRSEGTLVLRSSNVKDGEVIDADNVYVDSAIVNSENVQERDIIVVVRNGSRALIGKHAEIKGFKPNTVIGAFMTGIRSEHSSFLNALLNTPHFNKEIAINMGATINQITGYMFSKMEFLIPSANEQDEIGEYFKNLDYLITLHQRKLEKLKNIKKSCLVKMFI